MSWNFWWAIFWAFEKAYVILMAISHFPTKRRVGSKKKSTQKNRLIPPFRVCVYPYIGGSTSEKKTPPEQNPDGDRRFNFVGNRQTRKRGMVCNFCKHTFPSPIGSDKENYWFLEKFGRKGWKLSQKIEILAGSRELLTIYKWFFCCWERSLSVFC